MNVNEYYFNKRTGQSFFNHIHFPLQTKDTIDPTCNVTNVVGTCNIGSDLCACVNHTWSMDVVVGDEGFGLRQIFPNGAGSNQSFTHDNFQIGHNISMGVIHASLGYV